MLDLCLVENAQIQHALEAQDEKDRLVASKPAENQSETPKPKTPSSHFHSTLPSGTFSVHKKCLSCGGANSTLTGAKSSITYSPSPLFYRNQKFKRLELIGLMCRMLEISWGLVAKNFPWNKADFEQILLDAAQALRSEDSEAFPVLQQRRRTAMSGRRPKPC